MHVGPISLLYDMENSESRLKQVGPLSAFCVGSLRIEKYSGSTRGGTLLTALQRKLAISLSTKYF